MSNSWIQRVLAARRHDAALPPHAEEPTEPVEDVTGDPEPTDIEAEADVEAEDESRHLIDPLTKIPNRRNFKGLLAKETAHDDDVTAAVLLVDLDHFKHVNDEHGSPVGDAVLRAVAARLGSILRETDFLARWGGAEFAILAPGMPVDGLVGFADRARNALSKSPIVIGGASIALTASVGAVLTSPELHTPEHILAAADEALLEAKAAGRDCVRVYEPGVTLPDQP